MPIGHQCTSNWPRAIQIFKKILDDGAFRATLGESYMRKVYDRLQAISPESY
jgi:hypothetical protein